MANDWARYWRAGDRPLEAMYAHFERHVYHRHSHDTYSFGVTDEGAQTFSCRGARHTSAAGMVMAFNPDDPHDGHATDALGFTYRMVHIGPELVSDVLDDLTGRNAGDLGGRAIGLPLFAAPVVDDPLLAGRLRALHAALLGDGDGDGDRDGDRDGDGDALRRDELLTATISALVRRAATTPPRTGPSPGRGELARRTRELIEARYLDDLSPDDLTVASGASRFTIYRAFHGMYGMPPSDYQRQLRLREARRLIDDGRALGDVAHLTGFADQAHLTRWFTRYFGLPPGAYRAAVAS